MDNNVPAHKSVMMNEVLEILNPKSNETYIDCTLGAGGHTRAILESAKCHVIGIDRDPTVFSLNEDLYKHYGDRLTLIKGRFGELKNHIFNIGIKKVDAIFIDLGVSSMQLDTPERGFSFRFDAPLDMRMDDSKTTVFDIVNKYKEEDLAKIIYLFGEERKSRRIAKNIIEYRKNKKIETTFELSNIIKNSIGGKYKKIHPSTKTFQGLRIYLNDELKELYQALISSESILNEGGRLIVISFHSLEDRIVKNFIKYNSISEKKYKLEKTELPFYYKKKRVTKPSETEINENPRSRSAHLRYAYRTSAKAALGNNLHNFIKYGGVSV